jgi:putative ABC transport system permease protein
VTALVRVRWVRTRVCAAPLASLLAFLLAFSAVFLATALPRMLERASDQALRSFLRHAGPVATQLQATARADGRMDVRRREQSLEQVFSAIDDQAGPDLPFDTGNAAYGEQSLAPRELPDPGLPRPDGLNPTLGLVYLESAADHARLVSGRWPGAPRGGAVDVALSQDTARTLGVRLGQVLHTVPLETIVLPGGPAAMSARVVGLFTADDPAGRFWTGVPCLVQACLTPSQGDHPPPEYWSASALVDSSAMSAALGMWSGGPPTDFWRLPLDTERMRSDRLDAALSAVAGFQSGPNSLAVSEETGRDGLTISSGLPGLFAQEQARQAAVRPLTAVGPAGLAGVVAVVLCLAAGLAAERRESEVHLLRARGGSSGGLLVRLLGEGLSTVLPAAASAIPLALALLPTDHWLAPVLAGAGAALVTLLAFPLRLLARNRLGVRAPSHRAARRVVAELAVLAAAVAAVLEVRRRGVSGLDPLLIAAPLLLAAVGAVLLARSQPLLIGALARASARGGGAVGFLGLARAARGTGNRRRPSVLPLLALTLAVTTVGFGAAAMQSVVDSRAAAARLAVGGDASVTGPVGSALPAAVTRALAGLPGLRVGSSFWEQDNVPVWNDGPTALRATVVAVDPGTYARIAAAIGRGTFDPALLTGRPGGAGERIPALVSADIAGSASPDHAYRLVLDDEAELQVTGVGTVTGTPALPDPSASVVVVPAVPAAEQAPETGKHNRWLGLGAISDARLHAVVPSAYGVDSSAGRVAALADDPSQSAATGIFWDCTIATWCFAMLAVLLTLLRAGPERGAMLARLRTMGLRPRQGMTLILTEALPQALVAALGGGLAAAAAVLLVGPAVDLSPLVGAQVPTGIALTAPPILGQTLIVAALAGTAVLAEAAVQGRRQITTELRAGDGR